MPIRLPRLLAAALTAADDALYVFPVIPQSKTPAVRDWEHVATRDPEQITNWWGSRPYNVGAAVGRSGLVVVDLDTANGESPPDEFSGATSGREVLDTLAARAGEPTPVDTYTVATPTVINGTDGRSLHCPRRSIMTVTRLVESVLSAVVLRRDETVAASPGDGGS